jgi:hypothetical protein
MAMHKFRIRSAGLGQGTVEMDDVEVRGVLRFEVRGGAGEIPEVTLTMFAAEVDVETGADLKQEPT